MSHEYTVDDSKLTIGDLVKLQASPLPRETLKTFRRSTSRQSSKPSSVRCRHHWETKNGAQRAPLGGRRGAGRIHTARYVSRRVPLHTDGT